MLDGGSGCPINAPDGPHDPEALEVVTQMRARSHPRQLPMTRHCSSTTQLEGSIPEFDLDLRPLSLKSPSSHGQAVFRSGRCTEIGPKQSISIEVLALPSSPTEIKSKEMERVRTRIPLDLVIEMLSWLPARSLVRFRRVCKLWLSITSDPQFIDTNLDRSHKSRPPSVLLFLPHCNRDHCGITVIDDDPKRTPDRLLIVQTRSHDHRWRNEDRLCMSFPCNGLVCISDVNGCIELLNPTTGERHTPPPLHKWVDTGCLPIPSLGFHPETKEYKVVRFYWPLNGEWRVWCQVYTLGTNSWRQIPYPRNGISSYTGVNVNGALYWRINIGSDYDGRDNALVSFDLKNERFARISSPDVTRVYRKNSYLIGGVVELQGSVCLPVYPNSGKRTDIWMMVLSSNDDDTAMHEWALKYSVCCFMPVPLFIHNERILASECPRPKSKDKEEPPSLVYHHHNCKDGCTREAYREGKPVRPLIYHYLKDQDESNFEEFYRSTGICYSQSFAHVESLVSLRNQ